MRTTHSDSFPGESGQGCKIVVSQGYRDADNLKSIANDDEANVIEPIPVEFQRRSQVGGALGCVAEAADGKVEGNGAVPLLAY